MVCLRSGMSFQHTNIPNYSVALYSVSCMKLILLRHGDRSPGFNDIPLSDKGYYQAQKLTQENTLQGVSKIYSSPKRRARETVEPLCQMLEIPAEITLDLDQMKQIESPLDFTNRVQRVLDGLPKTGTTTILLCSHSDWLQTAVLCMDQTFTSHAFFSCAEYKIFSYENMQWKFLS
jgi:broad specificity phosphatase PhoE